MDRVKYIASNHNLFLVKAGLLRRYIAKLLSRYLFRGICLATGLYTTLLKSRTMMINYLYSFKRNYGRFIKACYDIDRKYEVRKRDNFAIGGSSKRTAQKSRVHGSEN